MLCHKFMRAIRFFAENLQLKPPNFHPSSLKSHLCDGVLFIFRQTIKVSAVNNLNLGHPVEAQCEVITQHPVTAISLKLSNDGFVPIDNNAGMD